MFTKHANFIDSLVVNFLSEDKDFFENAIAREFSNHKGYHFQKIFCSWNFEVKVDIRRMYPIYMNCNAGIDLRLTKKVIKNNYQIEIKLFRPQIWSDPIPSFIKIKNEVISKFGKGRFSVKRIDLCVHVAGYEFNEKHRKLFSGRFKKNEDYLANTAKGKKFSGFSFGSKKSPLSLKVYNKSIEVVVNNSCNPLSYYDVTPIGTVWCIEFTFLRDFLNKKGVAGKRLTDPDDLFEHLSSLWIFATTEFVKLKIDDERDSNLARKDVEPFWNWISNQWGEGEALEKIAKELEEDEEKIYDRKFNRLYRVTKELQNMKTVNGYEINILDIVKRALEGKKTTSKNLKG